MPCYAVLLLKHMKTSSAKCRTDKNSAVPSYGIGTRIIAHFVSKYAAEAVEKECLMPRGRIQIENRDLVVVQ